MKKKLLGLTAIALITVGLAACGNGGNETTDSTGGGSSSNDTLVVGASPTPHAEILEHVKPLLEEEGINLEIKKFDDYVLPNKSLAEGELDANYFQHKPFFEKAVSENDYDFADVGAIHIEPMGLYSKKITDIKDLEDGATIICSNSVSDWGRVISILEEADLVTVNDGVDIETATFDDIRDNPKELKFNHTVNPELLASTYNNDEGDLVAINANFAYGAGLNPINDSILLESDNSPYVNIIATRSEDKDDERIQKLLEVLHSEDVQAWILENWDGSVKPVNE
ncbi:MetQ/NlpA family ABC transporter substrate-binding protein [Enterococcus sp. AZ109]|uniref:MetQ/NlpA family ABC transporter substrate-binding protein n=1 Tax=Enterococcus sp. AZ109 TaxID=2774634 RepID=UPI003F25B448